MTLDSLYREAHSRSPRLAAAAARTNAAGAMERSAGLLPDPTIEVGVMNFSLPGLSANMPTSMAPSVQAMQMLPIGKLGLNRRIAEQTTATMSVRADEEWWSVRSAIAMAFYDLWQSNEQIVVMQNTRVLLENFHGVARAMYAAGQGKQTDVLRAGVEVARMAADIRRMEAMRSTAAARLQASLNRPLDSPIGSASIDTVEAVLPAVDTLIAWAESTSPMVARGRIEVAQASDRIRLAKRELWPDITIGLQYGQRRTAAEMGEIGGNGTERMGSVMIGFSLPVYARNRQMQMRSEATAMADMSAAELATMRADVRASVVEISATIERAASLISIFRSEIIPQARGAVQSALTAYRVAQVDFMTLLDAQMTLNEYEQELVVLRAERGAAIAELEMVIGRELPRVTLRRETR